MSQSSELLGFENTVEDAPDTEKNDCSCVADRLVEVAYWWYRYCLLRQSSLKHEEMGQYSELEWTRTHSFCLAW